MFENVLGEETLKLAKRLSLNTFPDHTYLAGGTALALHLGHRKSADLDFFTTTKFKEEQWEQKLEKGINFKLVQRDWQTLIGTSGEVKISLFGYKYPLISSLKRFLGLKVADLPDLAGMKIDTLLTRGTKRDFIDIYYLAKKFGLRLLLGYYNQKFGNLGEREIMIKKALLYFEDADKDEMPQMLFSTNWEEVKKWFIANTPEI